MKNFTFSTLIVFLISCFATAQNEFTSELNPINGAFNVSVDQELTVVFDRIIQSTDDELLIQITQFLENGEGTTVAQASIAEGNLILTDDGAVSTITIIPMQPLPENKNLFVDINEGHFTDLSGNPWQGFNSFGTSDEFWQFTTEFGDTPCISGNLDLEINFDNFAEETSWRIINADGSAILASASYTNAESNGSVTEQITDLPNGTYQFIMQDSFGDGICCAQGNGSYKVSKNDIELFSGSIFGSTQAFIFCIDSSVDSERPIIVCPETITSDAGTSCSSTITLVNPTATDNVSGTLSFEGIRSDGRPLSNVFDLGETTISWTATDETGNISEACEQVVSISGSGDCWFDVGPKIVGNNENNLGAGVSINADGDIVAYVNPDVNGRGNVGEVTVLQRSGSAWNEMGSSIPGGQLGRGISGVDLNDTGNRIAVSQDSGDVGVYEFVGGSWQPVGSVISKRGDTFIQKVDFDASGNRLAIGYAGGDFPERIGTVFVYEWSGGQWSQLGQQLIGIETEDFFGRDVSLNAAGNRLAVGAYQATTNPPKAGFVRIFELVGANWSQLGDDISGDANGDFFGVSVGLNDEGNRLVVGANAGKYAKVLELQNGNWIQMGSNLSQFPSEQPGYQVDINGGGDLVLIGNFEQPGRIYQWIDDQWQQLGQSIFAGVGQDVAMNKTGDIIVMGTPDFSSNSGKVGIFEYAGDISVTDMETSVMLSDTGVLQVLGVEGNVDDVFVLTQNVNNLSISNSGGEIAINGDGIVRVSANTVEVPLENITNGIEIDGGDGLNSVSIDANISLLGENNGLTVRDTDVLITGTGNFTVNALNIFGGDYDTTGSITEVITVANFFEGLFDASALTGTGTLLGNVNMNDQIIDPGPDSGILSTGNLVLEDGSAYLVDFSGPTAGTQHDQIKVTGTVTLDSVFLDLNGDFEAKASDELIIIDNDGTDPVIGTFAGLAEGAAVNEDFVGTISYNGGDGNDVVLSGTGSSIGTQVAIDDAGRLIITDSNGNTDDAFELTTNGNNLRIKNTAATITSDIVGAVQIDSETVDIPIPPVLNGIFFRAESGNNTILLGPELDLSRLGANLALFNLNVTVAENANVQVAGLNVNDGSFDLNGAIVPITFGEAGFFNTVISGEGNIEGPVSLRGTSIISPGTSPGIIATGDLTFEADSGFEVEINGLLPGTGHDQIQVSGSVRINEVALNLLGGFKAVSLDEIILIDNDGSDSVEGTFTNLSEGTEVSFGEFTGTIGYEGGDGNDVVLKSIVDNEPPVITCNESINTSSEVDNCGIFRSSIDSPTAIDNVSQGEDIAFSGVRDDGMPLISTFPIGKTIITWTATDEAGNTSEVCQQEVNIVDDILPVVSCPPDINVLSEDGVSMVLDIGVATATDNCTEGLIINATRSDQKTLEDSYPLGTTTILWETLDEAGNSGRCLQTITILNDGTSASGNAITELSIPFQIGETKIDEEQKRISVTMPFGTDLTMLSPNIAISVGAIVSPASGETSDFTEPVTYTVTAQNGFSQEWTVDIEAVQNTDTLIVGCPSDIFVENDLGQCGAIVNFDIGFTPKTPNTTLTLSHASGDFFKVGTTEVTATLSNTSGETTSCSFNVDVIDTEAPVTSCNDITVRLSPEGYLLYDTDDIIGAISDNCELAFIRNNGATEIEPGLFETNIEVADVNGNVSTCIATITVLPSEQNELIVTGFTLIDAETDMPIRNLVDGEMIDINELPTTRLDIRANVTDGVESVTLSIAGELQSGRTESLVPYALFQDLPIGDYKGEDFVTGEYVLTATAFSDDNGKGNQGVPLTLGFTLTDKNPACEDFTVDVEIVNPSDCEDDISRVTVVPSGGKPPYEVAWGSFSFVGEVVDGLTPGTYSATVTDADDCSVPITVEIEGCELAQITGFTLIDADTDTEIYDLQEGQRIDITSLPTRHLDIRANTTGGAESVRLSLTGALQNERTESLVPYALFRDLPIGDYIGADFIVGNYSVSATPYSADALGGDEGLSRTLNFELFDPTPSLAVTGFTLIDADTDQPLLELEEGMVIDIADLPTLHLDIRANTTEDVESVRLSLSGELETARTEILVPYALYRDLPIGDYIGNDFVVGDYAVSATPYSKDGLLGNVGHPLTVTFELVDTNQLVISPNQASTFVEAKFSRPTDLDGVIKIFDMAGRLVKSYDPSKVRDRDSYRLDLNFFQPGTYFIRMTDSHGRVYRKQVIVKGR